MTEDEKDLLYVERCRNGDLESFGRLVEKYQSPVFNVIFHMVGSYEDARELSQQVFMKAFEHLGTFKPDRRFFSWIYRMAINESINHLKGRRDFDRLGKDMPSERPDPETEYESVERLRDVREAVMALSAEYRAVVILRHFLHHSYCEAAAILDIPEKTVKSRLFTGRQLLRAALAAKGYTR